MWLYVSVTLFCLSCVKSMSIQTPNVDKALTDSTTDAQDGDLVHCYCNLPECVRSSYMCKSSLGCFSDLVANLDVDRALHGCLHLLPPERGVDCQNVPGGSGSDRIPVTSQPASLLICCKKDMCNHVDSPETRVKYNETILASVVNTSEGEEVNMVIRNDLPQMSGASYSSQEVWFKAATIAVPICGAMILLMLVLLAMKILRSDVLDHHSIIASKLRNKEGGSGGGLMVGGGPVRLVGVEDKKHPLLFHQRCHQSPATVGVHPVLLTLADKNARNAHLNSRLELTQTGLFHKCLDLGSCNIYHNTTDPLLPNDSKEKLLYKKATFVSWPPPEM